MKRVIITGPTGSIGTALTDILTRDGCEVYAICRPGSENICNLPKNPLVHVIECDISDTPSLKDRLTPGFDAFYHFAWNGTFGSSRDDIKRQSDNIQYTLDAVKTAKELACEVFIGAGSQAEIGHFDAPGNESTPTYPFTFYGAAKLSAGHMSRVYANMLGIRHVWGRIFSVYGPNDDPGTLISLLVDEISQGHSPDLTLGEQHWDYLFSYDAAEAFALMATKGRNNALYSLGGGERKLLRDYIIELRDLIDPTVELGFGKRAYSDNQVMYVATDTTAITKDLGFTPRYSFKEGIQTILNRR